MKQETIERNRKIRGRVQELRKEKPSVMLKDIYEQVAEEMFTSVETVKGAMLNKEDGLSGSGGIFAVV